jgi:hypothetical protein
MKLQLLHVTDMLRTLISLPKQSRVVKDGMAEWVSNKEQSTYSNNVKPGNENELLLTQKKKKC